MGNYCSCVCSNPNENKIQEIEEVKRGKNKLWSHNEDEKVISGEIYSMQMSTTGPKDILLKSYARRYLTQKFFSDCRPFKIFSNRLKVIYGELPTIPKIREIETTLPSLSVPENASDKKRYPVVQLSEGSYYQGPWNFISEKPEGFGSIVYLDYSKYIGYFKDGKKSGKGCLITIEGEVLAGIFTDDYLTGHGILKKSNGLIYKGNFEKNIENGQGTLETNNCIIYEGSFVNGAKHGKGKLCLPDGNMYTGEFVQNMIEGQGTYIWKDGKQYKGTWKNNKIHGVGVYNWPDGREYQGSYVDGLRDGYGIFKWQDGKEYRGEWEKGNMHGIGVYTYLDKNGELVTVKAVWENGKKIKEIR